MHCEKMAAPSSDNVGHEKRANKQLKQKKRSLEHQHDDRDGPEIKKKKVKQDEFDDIQFKVLLRDPKSRSTALEKFLEQAGRYPDETKLDIIATYCGGSPECAEIFVLLEEKERKVSEVHLIFQVLERILMRLAEDLPQLHLVASSVVRQILASHMPQVYSALNTQNKTSRVKTALRLLVSMVMQGPSLARGVAAQFHFSHRNFSHLLNKRDPADEQDVRTCVLQFMVAFLVVGDTGTVQQVVEAKEFFHLVFPGLVADKPSTLEFVLSTLLEKVVKNTGLRKTTKMQLFHQRALCDLGRLYSWKGAIKSKRLEKAVAEATEGASQPQESEEDTEDRKAVRRYVHQLLLEICTSRKHGLVFADKTFGTSDKNHNLVLTHFLRWFTAPYQRVETCELVVKTLVACPDQLRWYLPTLKHSLTPRLSPRWLAAATFLLQVYQQQPVVSPALQGVEPQTPNRLVAMVMATLLPPGEVWSQFSLAVRKRSQLVRHRGLGFLVLVLQRALASLDHCRDSVPYLSTQERQDFCTILREQLTKALPSIREVYKCWMFAARKDGDEEEDIAASDGDGEEGYEGVGGVEEVSQVYHMTRVLQVICMYQSVLPHTTLENPPNFPALLEGVRGLLPQDEEDSPGNSEPATLAQLQLYLLKLLSESDPSQLAWLKESVGKRSMLYLLWEMRYSCKENPELAKATSHLLCKLFAATGAFPGCEEEIPIWLNHLAATEPGEQQDVLAFLERSMSAVLRDPYTYSEKVFELVAEANTVETSSGQDAADPENLDTMIDFVLSMEEVAITDPETETEEKTEDKVHQSKSFPFSPMVVACLEELPEPVLAFVSCVLSDIIHQQVEPLALCLLIHHQRSSLTNTSLFKLIAHWLPKKLKKDFAGQVSPVKKPIKGSQEPILCELLKATFTNGQDAKPKMQAQLRAQVHGLEPEQGVSCVQQVLLYLTTAAKSDSQTVEFYFLLLKDILEELNLQVNIDEKKKVEVLENENLEEQETVDSKGDELVSVSDTADDQSRIHVHSAEKTNEDIASLNLPVKTWTETLCDVYRRILSHPHLQRWFLWQGDGSSSELTPLVTRQLAAIFKGVPAGVGSLLMSDLDIYRRKIEQALSTQQSVKETKIQKSSSSLPEVATASLSLVENQAVVDALDGFIPWINSESQVKVIDCLLSLPPESLVTKDNKCLTKYGSNLVYAANFVLDRTKAACQRGQPIFLFSHSSICKLVNLVTNYSVSDLDDLLAVILCHCPVYVTAVTRNLMNKSLESASSGKLQVAAAAVKHSATCRAWCSSWCCVTKQLTKPETKFQYLPLARVMLTYCYSKKSEAEGNESPQDLERRSAVLKSLGKAFWKDLVSWLLGMHKCPLLGQEAASARLDILHCIAATKTTATLTSTLHGLDQVLRTDSGIHRDQLRFYKHLTQLLADSTSPGEQYLVTCLHCLANQAAAKHTEDLPQKETLDWLIDEVEGKAKVVGDHGSLADHIRPFWNQFIKSSLRSLFTHPKMLQTLSVLIPFVYAENASPVAPSVKTFHQMVMSHSQFLSSLLQEEVNSPAKDGLVNLLLTLVQQDPTCCETSHIAVILGAYQASLHVTDRKLLLLLECYEANKCSLTKYRPYLWGAHAVEHYSVMKNLGPSLTKQPSMEQVLEGLDTERMTHTIHNFPLTRKLQVEGAVEASDWMLEDVYDPCFLLPLFSHLLAPESLVNCSAFMERQCLGLALAALSSHDALMRGATYHILTSFRSHLEGAKIAEKEQVLYLLEVVQYSVEKANMKLAPIITTFLARAACILTQPDDPMYQVINAFLLVKPSLDTLHVPEFYKLFNSSSLEFKTERAWMLQLLYDGLRETADYRIFEKRYTFKQLLSFHDSLISDQRTRLLVLKIVAKACSLKNVALDLAKKHSILSWLCAVSSTCGREEAHMEMLVQAVHNLWFTLLGDRGTPGSSAQIQGRECLPIPFTNTTLTTALTLLTHASYFEKLEVFDLLVKTLQSVLVHVETTRQQLLKNNASTAGILHPQLHQTHVLLLLRHWSSLAKEEELQQEVTSLLDVVYSCGVGRSDSRMEVREAPDRRGCGAVSEKQRGVLGCLLDILTRWMPHHATVTGASPAVFASGVLLTIRWCLQTLSRHFQSDCDRYMASLRWLNTVLTRDTASPLPAVLLNEAAGGAQVVVQQLLGVYGVLANMAATADQTSLDISQHVTSTTSTICQLNDSFLLLWDYAMQHRSETGVVGQMAGKAAYRRSLLHAAQGPNTSLRTWVLSHLVQELWLGASKPQHSSALLSAESE